MRMRAVMFDLDGTLLDTIDDLADSLNAVLTTRNYPARDITFYKQAVGEGVEMLVRRSLPAGLSETIVTECVAAMRLEYGKNWDRKTRPYPHIPEMLNALQKMDIPMTILSNKPDDTTGLVVAKLLPEWKFVIVRGARKEVPKKPDPAGALEIAASLKIPPAEIAYLGDTCIDMKTAVSAGMYPVGALWGFRDEPELRESGAKMLIKDPLDFLRLF